MTSALITTNPYAVVDTFPDGPVSFRLPSGDLIEGAQVGWTGDGYALVAVIPFTPSSGQQTAGAPSYSVDGSGNVTETYATQAIPPSSMQLVSTSTSSLNGSYAIDPDLQQKVAAVSLYIQENGKFPDGLSVLPWPDLSGMPHNFSSTASFQAFATALADFVTALVLGQTPTQPVTIA